MKRTPFLLAGSLAVVLSLAALGIGAGVDRPSTLMSPTDYNGAKRAIEAHARLTYARCRLHKEAPREVCRTEARAGERVKVAELQARYYGTVAAAEESRAVKFKAGFDVARARCVAQGKAQQADCLRAAREQQARALADAKLAST